MGKKKRQRKKEASKSIVSSGPPSKSEFAQAIQGLELRFESYKESVEEKGEDPYADLFCLRMRRALSWAKRAAQSGLDDDLAFVCLWIAFNASYANCTGEEHGGESREKERFKNFFEEIEKENTQEYRGSRSPLRNMVWLELFGDQGKGDEIEIQKDVIENKFLYHLFWIDQHQNKYVERVDSIRTPNKHSVKKAISSQNTVEILSEIFIRLYVLRNQLVHGGATWSSSINRKQVKIGRLVLEKLLPVLFDVMLDSPEEFAGKPFYPVVSMNPPT